MVSDGGVIGGARAAGGGALIRDDRILPETRWLSAFIVPFLFVAFVMLYIFPGHTDRLFAWTIRPDMTPLIMGAGYISGSYFFVHAFFARRWHTVHLGFLPITAFTIFMAIATGTSRSMRGSGSTSSRRSSSRSSGIATAAPTRARRNRTMCCSHR
jgi:hypothetical protein